MVAVCEATGMAVTYFTQLSKESENLPLMQNFINWFLKQYNLDVKVIRSDNKMNLIETTKWYSKNSISFKLCALDTHSQNGGTKRFGWSIIEKVCAMHLLANLLHRFWRKIVSTATYLYNHILRALNNWKSPYKAFYSYVFDQKKVSSPQKLLLHHFRAYSCKVFIMIKSKRDPQYCQKHYKLDPKTHIGFLAGYKSTSIYRIWVPQKKVVSVKNVIFDKDKVWDGTPLQRTARDIKQLDNIIELIELPQTDKLEDIQLNEDLEELEITHQTDNKTEDLDLDADNIAANVDKLAKDEEWAQNQYPTPDPSVLEAYLTNSIAIPVASQIKQHLVFDQDVDLFESEEMELFESERVELLKFKEMKPFPVEYVEPARLEQLSNQQSQRFYNFAQHKVLTKLQTAFVTGIKIAKVHRQDLSPESVNYQELKSHLFEKSFCTDIKSHIQQHRNQFRF